MKSWNILGNFPRISSSPGASAGLGIPQKFRVPFFSERVKFCVGFPCVFASFSLFLRFLELVLFRMRYEGPFSALSLFGLAEGAASESQLYDSEVLDLSPFSSEQV